MWGGWNSNIPVSPQSEKYDVYTCMIEEYKTKKKYDIVIAEGFIQALSNAGEIVECIKPIVKPGGIVIITTSDEAGLFVEMMKRLIGVFLAKECNSFDEKVSKLTEIFKPQLQTLKYVSKTPESWVKESILSPLTNNGCFVRMTDAIDMFGEEYYVIGSSPKMFTDYSWHKNIDFDSTYDCITQYNEKRLSLSLAGERETVTDQEITRRVCELMGRAINYTSEYEKTANEDILNDLEKTLVSIIEFKEVLEIKLVEIIGEIIKALNDARSGEFTMNDYPLLFSAFGMAMNYIAFEKK